MIMRLNLNTNIVECIIPDTYGSDFQYVIADDMWNDFKNLMIEKAKEYLTEALYDTDFSEAVISNMTFNSPEYYNFETDRIDFDIEFSDGLIDTIKEKADDEFFTWIRRYGSYDGFISTMPTEKHEFMDALDYPADTFMYKLEKAVAMFISYQIHKTLGKDISDYEIEYLDDVMDYAFSNGYVDDDYYEDMEAVSV